MGGCHVEDDWGQGVVLYCKREKMNWCGCKEVKKESGAPRERKSTTRVEKAAWPREAKAQQGGAQSGEPESTARGEESSERVQKGIAYWDKQNHAVLAPNCVLKV